MPPPRRTSLAAANKIFVDRTEPQIAFERAALHIPADRSSLLVYYGVGGQGKTALCRELLRKTDPAQEPSYGFLRRALLDLHGRPKTDPDLLLVWLRNAFAKAGVPTPCFDLAFAIVWDATRGEQELPAMESAWLARQKDVAGQVASEGFAKIGEAISEAATSVPVFGKLFSFAAKWSIRKGYEKYLHATREALAEMYDGAELKPAFELSQLLPWMLAQDLNHHLAAHPDARFVLLIDEYERVFDQGGAGTLWRDNPFDRHVRSFVQETNGLLAVFFSRERLPWDDDPAWKDDLADTQHLLGGLSDGDADDFLKAIPVPDAALRAAMIAGARETAQPGSPVYPLMLDLQVEHWRELVAQNRQISPEMFNVAASDFVARRNDIIKRVLRDYEQPMQSTLIRLACARRFDRTTFEYAVREFYTGLSLDAFERLADLSFINRAPDGYLSFHGIVRDVLQEMLPKEERERVMESLFLHFEMRSSAPTLREIGSAQVAAFFEAAYLREQLSKPDYLAWLAKAYEPLLEAAKYNECLELWRQTLTATLERRGDGHADCATCLLQIAKILSAQGSYRESVSMGEQTLNMFVQIGAASSAGAAESMTIIGQSLAMLGEHARAQEILQRAVEENTRIYGRVHRETATAINGLGLLLRSKGEFEAAESALKEALSIYEKVSGPAHQDVAAALSNLALVLGEQLRHKESIPLQRRALAICEKTLGTEHPHLATMLGNLGNSLFEEGDHESAILMFERALAFTENTLGLEHASTAFARNNLLAARGSAGDFEETRSLFMDAISVHEKALGADHPDTMLMISNLATHYQEHGHTDEAKTLFEKLFAAREKKLGADHPDTIKAAQGLAFALFILGSYEEETILRKRILSFAEKTFGGEDIATGLALNNLAVALWNGGNMEEPEALLNSAIEILENVAGNGHPETIQTLTNLGGFLSQRGDLDRAKAAFEKALAALEALDERPAEQEVMIAYRLNDIALILEAQEEFLAARLLFAKSLSIVESLQGTEHPDVLAIRENIERNEAALAGGGEETPDIASKPSIH